MARSTRMVEIQGRRTTFRLEQQFWDAAHRCARERGLHVNQLITHVVQEHRVPDTTMSAAVRVYLIGYYRDRVLEREMSGGTPK